MSAVGISGESRAARLTFAFRRGPSDSGPAAVRETVTVTRLKLCTLTWVRMITRTYPAQNKGPTLLGRG